MAYESDFDIFCPHCAHRIDLPARLGRRRLLTAVSLQVERLGTAIYCTRCGMGFLYTRLYGDSVRHLQRSRKSSSSKATRSRRTRRKSRDKAR